MEISMDSRFRGNDIRGRGNNAELPQRGFATHRRRARSRCHSREACPRLRWGRESSFLDYETFAAHLGAPLRPLPGTRRYDVEAACEIAKGLDGVSASFLR